MCALDRALVEPVCVFFQAEDGIRDLVRSRGLGDVYKRQGVHLGAGVLQRGRRLVEHADVLVEQGDVLLDGGVDAVDVGRQLVNVCLLYTSPSPRDRTRSRMPSSA